MAYFRVHVWAGAAIAALLVGLVGRADEQPGGPKLFGFCMNVADSKHRSLPEQAQMLRELGFDGAAYGLWLGEELDRNLRTFDAAGLKIYMFEVVADLTRPFDPRSNPPGIGEAVRKLKGRPAILSVQLRGLPPGDPRVRSRRSKCSASLATWRPPRVCAFPSIITWATGRKACRLR